jgi:FAD/FMN-containing dehydrogenase
MAVTADPGPSTNWAGNVRFRAAAVRRPTSVAELRRVVASSRRVRALGTGHSFSTVADTDGTHVRVDGLPATVEVDDGAGTANVSAGMRYGEVVGRLHERGWALPNLGSLPHIAVAGAASTGTHGSGDGNQVLAGSVVGLELVTASGDLLTVDRTSHPDTFDGSVVAMGSLGVLTRLTLRLVPTFDVEQQVREGLSHEALFAHLDEVMGAGYSVSLFTDWSSPAVEQVWLKRLAGSPPLPADWFGTTAADGARHPVAGMPVEHCTEQLGVVGPWHERLPHFRLQFTPSSGDELQTEYLVPREHGVEALRAVAALGERIAPVLQVGEVRSVAADDLWLSAAHGRDSLCIHFTWEPDAAAVMPVVAAVEAALEPFEPRPHWGKVFTTDPATVASRYPRLADFVALRDAMDPDRRFANEFVDRYLA